MISTKMKETAMYLRKVGLNAQAYRQLWHKDGNLANRVFELFTAEEQQKIIKELEEQLAATWRIWIFERSKINSCLQTTRMVQSLSQEKREKRKEYQRKRAAVDEIGLESEEIESTKQIDKTSPVDIGIFKNQEKKTTSYINKKHD